MKIYPGSATLPALSTMQSARSDLSVAVPHLSRVFCSVENASQKPPPIIVDPRLAGLSAKVASLETKLGSVWPLPKNLALHVRYQFGSYPCSYNDLAKAGRDVKAAVTQCHSALASLEANGKIDKKDEKMISHLLHVITLFDKQCEVWSKIVGGSRSHELLGNKMGCEDGVVNPFVGVRNNLLALRAPLLSPRVR